TLTSNSSITNAPCLDVRRCVAVVRLLDRRAVAGRVIEPLAERERCLRVIPVVRDEPFASLVISGYGSVIADDRFVTAGIGDLPGKPSQRRDLLEARCVAGDHLAAEHTVHVDPLA